MAQSVFDQVKIATAQKLAIWYKCGHEKTLLGFSLASEPRRASISSPTKGKQLGSWLNLYRRRRATIPSPKRPSSPSEDGSGTTIGSRCKVRR